MLEDIPRHGPKLAEELRRVGAEIKTEAEKELADFYPTDRNGGRPIAYLWARTVRCEAPNCGAEIPLTRSFWLCRKANRKWALRYEVKRPKGKPPYVEFEIIVPKKDNDVAPGTINRAKARCLCCGAVLPPERVRAQLTSLRGGADVVFDAKGHRTGGAKLMAVVVIRPRESGRHYRLPAELDYEAVRNAQQHVATTLDDWDRNGKHGLCPVPNESTPAGGGSGAGRAFSVQKYGMFQWGDLFTARQKVTLLCLRRLLNKSTVREESRSLVALAITRFLDDFSSLVRWMDRETPAATFSRQALPILWDFCETCPFDDASWSFEGSVNWVALAVEGIGNLRTGQVQQADATESPLPDETASVWFTDPPYYDAIPYSDLSDYFLVWLKRMLPGHPVLQDPFDSKNPLSPKGREAVQDDARLVDGKPKDRAFFEDRMAKAFAESRRFLKDDGIGSVVFAHKTTEGWEALLSGIIRGGWVITSSWPIVTERKGRPRSHDSAALATSVHLVCRPRTDDKTGDWSDVLRKLPKRVGDWMERLQTEHVRGADLVFACIGPALEIYSRYSRVETADGREVPLAEYLEKVWEVVGRTALEQILGTAEAKARNGAAGALEEDARLTALFLWTLQSTNGDGANEKESEASDIESAEEDDDETTSASKKAGYSLIYDVARRFAQPLGIHLDAWENRIIETDKGVVRLLPVHERAKQLFGEGGAQSIAEQIERNPSGTQQLGLFPDEETPKVKAKKGRKGKTTIDLSDEAIESRRHEATTLDRIHAAMLLQAGGRTNALRALLKAEQERGPDFLRLANALSALYPRDSEEKRLLDAMLLAVPR